MNTIEQKEDTLIQLINTLPDAIVWVDPVYSDQQAPQTISDFVIRFCNTAVYTIFNLSGTSIEGYSLVKDKLLDDSITQQIINHPGSYSGEFFSENLHKWLAISIETFHGGYLIRIVDITHIKEQEQQLEQLAEKLQTVIDTSQAGIFLTSPVRDEKGKIIDWVFNTANHAVAALVGLTPGQLIGERGSKWFPAYMTNGLFDKYVETFTSGNTIRYELHYYEEDRIDIWVDIMVTKLGNELIVVFTDYTPVKQLQLQLAASVSELKKSNKSLEQFAYAASHDLQEPLRKINSFIDKLELTHEGILTDEGFNLIERIKGASKRMRSLINALLTLAEVSAQRNEFESVDLNVAVQEVINDLEVMIQEKEATIQIADLPVIMGDSIHLQQLFQNLITNSLKYSKPDIPPYITITSKLVTGDETSMDIDPQDAQKQFYLIEIKDNGIGFEQEHADRIFKIFKRLHGRNEYQGTGIGLTIVQKVIENHNGYIKAEGEPGIGATFKVLLPVAP